MKLTRTECTAVDCLCTFARASYIYLAMFVRTVRSYSSAALSSFENPVFCCMCVVIRTLRTMLEVRAEQHQLAMPSDV